jgi:hypothetical protein
MHTKIPLFLRAFALVWLSVTMAATSAPLEKKVLIIGVDGTMSEKLALARTPNLDAMKAVGAFTDKAITAPTTHSASCWSSMFTGVWMDKHGVTNADNSFTGNRFALYPNFFKRIEMFNNSYSTVGYARWNGVTNAWVGVDTMKVFSSDPIIVSNTCVLLTNGNPDVFFTILLAVDDAGHNPGWNTTNYIAAIETADGRVGQIMNALTNRATYTNEDWLVVVMADHGEHDSTMTRSRLVFQLFVGSSVPHGTIYPTPSIVDVCATVFAHMGIPIDPAWDLDARVVGLARPPIAYGTNLIFNGDAEFNSGTNNYRPDRGIAWWWDYAGTTLARYGSNAKFLAAGNPGPTNCGNIYFLGGTNGNTFVSQTIDVSEFSADIDDPGVDCELSGWLGGAGSRSNSTAFTARFLSTPTNALGTNTLGPVTTMDRGGTSALLSCTNNGTLPAGTRLVEFTLAMTSEFALTNDAAADNLSFVLTPHADPPFSVTNLCFTNGTWSLEIPSRTNRNYFLEYYDTSWHSSGPGTAGTGGVLPLSDPELTPQSMRLYRVRSERP